MRRYLHLSGAAEEQCAAVADKAFRNALRNPRAFRGAEKPAAEVMASPVLASPIRTGMAMVPADGACALLLADEESAPRFTDMPVWIAGAG